jgi:hypothetical protein
MATSLKDLFYGGFRIQKLDRPARCKGHWNCGTYGLNKKEFALTIPQGETVLMVLTKDQPLIYCKEHMKDVLRQMEEVLSDARKAGLYGA